MGVRIPFSRQRYIYLAKEQGRYLHAEKPTQGGQAGRCRANMARITQSKLDFCLGFQVNALTTFKVLSLSLSSDFQVL
jgi:hypothetical protein